MVGHQNQLREFKWNNRLDSLLGGHSEYVTTKWRTYVQIKYLNFENKEGTEYFDVSFTGGLYLNSDSIAKYFDSQKAVISSDRVFSIYDIDDPERLTKVLRAIK